MIHCYIDLKVQGQYCITASSFRVWVTVLVFCFLSLYLWSWTELRPAFENPKTNIFDESIKFLDWLFLVVLDGLMMMTMMMMMNCFCGMVDQRKASSFISRWYHCQRSSPSRISETPRAGFEPAQSSGFVEWSCALVITTTPRRHHYTTNRFRWF